MAFLYKDDSELGAFQKYLKYLLGPSYRSTIIGFFGAGIAFLKLCPKLTSGHFDINEVLSALTAASVVAAFGRTVKDDQS